MIFFTFFSQLATVLNHEKEVPWSINTGGMGLDKEPGRSIEVHEARDDLLKSLGGVWGRHILSQETTGQGDPTCHTKWTRCLVGKVFWHMSFHYCVTHTEKIVLIFAQLIISLSNHRKIRIWDLFEWHNRKLIQLFT